VADFIIEQNLNFERRLDVLGQQLARSAELLVRGFEKNQDWLCDQFSFMTGKRIEDESKQLIMVHDAIVNAYEHVIMQKNDELMRFDQLIDSMDPMNVLKKGYAYIMKNKDQVRTIEDLQKGDSIEVVMSDGNRKAEIN
jgi:exodeoxyribonuclease VII large subunit